MPSTSTFPPALKYTVHLASCLDESPCPLQVVLESSVKTVFVAGANLHSVHTVPALRAAMLRFLRESGRTLRLLLCDPRFRPGVETWTQVNPRTDTYNHRTHLSASIKYYSGLIRKIPKSRLQVRVTRFVPVSIMFAEPTTPQGLMVLTPVVHEGQVSADRPHFIVRRQDNPDAFRYYWEKHSRLFTDEFSDALPVKHGVFISHGRSLAWKPIAASLNRSGVNPIEFDYMSPVGKPISTRLQEMLAASSAGIIVMTAEDERRLRPQRGRKEPMRPATRENVIHEAGLCQAAFGFDRTVLFLENGCEEFSNIQGIVQIRFAKGRLTEQLPRLKSFLQREGLIAS